VVEHLRKTGQQFFDILTALAESYPAVLSGARGIPEMCYAAFQSPALSSAVAQAAVRRGLIFKRDAYNYVSLAHSDEVLASVIERLSEAVEEVAETC
jgi:4-aminobutyrate aminotransferase-like enzyme